MTDNRKDVTNNEVINFHPITCFPIMRKLLTGMIAGELHKPLEHAELLPGEQRGCRKKKRGTKDQLILGKMVIENCKGRLTNLAMGQINYKNVQNITHT